MEMTETPFVYFIISLVVGLQDMHEQDAIYNTINVINLFGISFRIPMESSPH